MRFPAMEISLVERMPFNLFGSFANSLDSPAFPPFNASASSSGVNRGLPPLDIASRVSSIDNIRSPWRRLSAIPPSSVGNINPAFWFFMS